MRIGIIGAGNVGGTLGPKWVRRGHDVTYAARDASAPKVAELRARLGGDARIATVADSTAFGEVLVLATPWGATRDALRSAGPLDGKVLLDCTNPLTEDFSALAVGHTDSGGEQVARWAPGARVVKIFNTTGFNNMEDPRYGGTSTTMFYCGDNAAAKAVAGQLAAALGFEPVDVGPPPGRVSWNRWPCSGSRWLSSRARALTSPSSSSAASPGACLPARSGASSARRPTTSR